MKKPDWDRLIPAAVGVGIIALVFVYSNDRLRTKPKTASPAATAVPLDLCPDAATYEIRMLALDRAHREIEILRDKYKRSIGWWKLSDAERTVATDTEMKALVDRLLAQGTADAKVREAFVKQYGANCGLVFDADFAAANKISLDETLSEGFVPNSLFEITPKNPK
jgi:hypothetical protein